MNFSFLALFLPSTIVGLNIMPTRRNVRRSWAPTAVISRQDSFYMYVYNRLNSKLLSIRPAASQRYHTIPKWRTSYNNKNSENENENWLVFSMNIILIISLHLETVYGRLFKVLKELNRLWCIKQIVCSKQSFTTGHIPSFLWCFKGGRRL